MVVNYKVVSRLDGKASKRDRDLEFRKMHTAFKNGVKESNVLILCKEKQYFESKGERKRRKRKESLLRKKDD